MLDPVVGQPALADPTTAALHVARRSLDRRKVGPLIGVLVAVFGAWYVSRTLDSALLFGLFLLLAAVNLGVACYALRARQLSLRAVGLLGERSWIPVDVEVLRGTTGITDVLADGAALRVLSLTAAHRAVLRRTGRAWVVGPTADGVAALRVEGSHEAWPARVLPTAPARRPAPSTDVVEPTLRAAEVRARRAKALLFFPAVLVVYAVYVATLFGGFQWYLFIAGMSGPLMALVLVVLFRHRLPDRRLPALVRAGDWVRAEVTVHSRTPRRDATAAASATLRLPDGATVAVVAGNAHLDLLGTITETGAVWVAGTVALGRTVALGFPGYPQVAAAKVTGS
ncbi:hypothetical protein JOD54_002849 [Actinokineospora baliensis]|uniref:hypothetical protein n=1 Tax=Actinokineospora baliensis TaxID=547056 RepID=UPI00195B0C74|nr:hypothetical protein [Actinokineospora baliensis]MBM7772645.1 hypothetical protein [Actinokineospora baliensis]